MQKHRKWPKTEGISTQKLLKTHRLGAFYITFRGYYFLEWFARKTCFVKYIYCFNKSQVDIFRDKNNIHVSAWAIRLNMMGAMMRTSLSPYWRNDIGQRNAYGVHVHPVVLLIPIGCPLYRACEEQKGAYFWWEVKPIFLFVGNLNTVFAVSNLLADCNNHDFFCIIS